MPGARQSAAMLEINGTAHMSQAKLDERRDSEVRVVVPDCAKPPKWLSKKHHVEYCRIGDILLAAGIFTELDRDVLGQYFVAFEQWLLASRKLSAAMRSTDDDALERVKVWSTTQKTAFSQARQCADSLGLSVTSRCRIVVPAAMENAATAGCVEEIDEFSAALAKRQQAAFAGGNS